MTHYYKGAIFETFVVSELVKYSYNVGDPLQFYFWRDNHQKEVDLIIEHGTDIKIVEIKSGKTFQKRFLKDMQYWITLTQTQPENAYLIFGGDDMPSMHGIHGIGWEHMTAVL